MCMYIDYSRHPHGRAPQEHERRSEPRGAREGGGQLEEVLHGCALTHTLTHSLSNYHTYHLHHYNTHDQPTLPHIHPTHLFIFVILYFLTHSPPHLPTHSLTHSDCHSTLRYARTLRRLHRGQRWHHLLQWTPRAHPRCASLHEEQSEGVPLDLLGLCSLRLQVLGGVQGREGRQQRVSE